MDQHHYEQDWCPCLLLVGYTRSCMLHPQAHFHRLTLWSSSSSSLIYGVTPDISIMLLYTFYQPIFYATHDQHFPSESEERSGYWVGFAKHCGDSLTHKNLDAETFKIIHRSALRPRTLKNPNKRLVDDGGEEDHQPHKNPLNIQLQIHQTHVLSISNQGVMMV